MAKRPPKDNFRQIPVLAFSEWSSVPAVKSALAQYEYGMFRDAALLVEAMGRDDRIEGVKETRLNALNGLPLEWTPADDSEKALRIAADVEKLFPKMVPEPLRNSHRAWALDMGLGLAELLWEDYGTSMWVPTIRVWNNQYVWWRADLWEYWLTTMDAGIIPLHSGDKGGNKWFMYAPYGLERGWMRGMVRSLAIPWLIRQWDWRDWARYNEIHGIPTRVGYVPANAEEPHKQRFINELAALGNETVIRCEQGAGAEGPKFDFKLVEAMSTNWEAFEKLLTQSNNAIAVRMLGQNLTTEIGGSGAGSRAAAQVHDRVRSDFLRSDASTYALAFKEQVLEPFCLFNYGSRQLAPTPNWKTDPPDDKKARADTLNLLGQALQALQLAGIPIDVIQVAKEYALPLTGDVQSKKPAADKDQATTSSDGEEDKKNAKPKTTKQKGTKMLKPHIEGQIFVDHVADTGVAAAKRAVRDDLLLLNHVVQASKAKPDGSIDYADMRKRLLIAFGKMKPSKLARMMEKCLLLADHSGRHSVLEEV